MHQLTGLKCNWFIMRHTHTHTILFHPNTTQLPLLFSLKDYNNKIEIKNK